MKKVKLTWPEQKTISQQLLGNTNCHSSAEVSEAGPIYATPMALWQFTPFIQHILPRALGAATITYSSYLGVNWPRPAPSVTSKPADGGRGQWLLTVQTIPLFPFLQIKLIWPFFRTAADRTQQISLRALQKGEWFWKPCTESFISLKFAAGFKAQAFNCELQILKLKSANFAFHELEKYVLIEGAIV